MSPSPVKVVALGAALLSTSCLRLGLDPLRDAGADADMAQDGGDAGGDAEMTPDAGDADRPTDADRDGDEADGDATPALVLEPILDQTGVWETTPIRPVDANEIDGDDVLADGTPILYACAYDRVVNGSVAAGARCDELGADGAVAFDPVSGRLDWTPALGHTGAYEIQISATAGELTAQQVFAIYVVRDERPTGLAVGETVRVSVGIDGAEANADSNGHTVALSDNGRFVVFTSNASNLIDDDTNGVADTFVADVLTGEITRVSVSSDGDEGDGPSDGSRLGATVSGTHISDDGYSVVFISSATNLVAGDTNDAVDVFYHDRRTGVTRRVSVSTDGVEANGDSQRAMVNEDGRYIVFQSRASNLVPNDTNDDDDCFRHDRATGATLLMSRRTDGQIGNGGSWHPRISSDGALVLMTSEATNLIFDDVNGAYDSIAHDVRSGLTWSVSRRQSDGQQCDANSWSACFSGDGAFITFHGFARNLLSVGVEDPAVEDVFQLRVADGFIRLVSESAGPEPRPGDGRSYVSRQDETGRFVSFNSLATNLLEGELVDNDVMDVYVKDMETGEVYLISRAADGGLGDGRSDRAYISRDGTHVAFESEATNLVEGDTNGFIDIFVHRFR